MKKSLPSLIGRVLVEAVAFAALIYFLLPPLTDQITVAKQVGNAPSALADGGSEFDALTSAMHYYKLGFLANAGLPDRGGPSGKPYDDPNDVPAMKLIYTHYPPGPNWLVGLAMMTFGPKQVPLYRSFPLVFSVAGLIMSYVLLRSAVGCVLASAATILLLQLPMTWVMMHGLFGHSYALTLSILQMSFVFSRMETRDKFSVADLVIISTLSFLHGWMSFDWAFIAMFHGLCIVSCWGTPSRRKNLVIAVVFAMFGFGFAHLLHFCQVWALAPNFKHAFEDLFGAAVFRSQGEGAHMVPPGATRTILDNYLFSLLPSGNQAREFSWMIPTATLSLVVFTRLILSTWIPKARYPRLFTSSLVAVSMSIIISLAWIVLMKNHALQQGHWLFLPRHFIALLYSCILVGILELRAVGDVCLQLIRALVPSRWYRHETSTDFGGDTPVKSVGA
jgi:hypothetical protein